MSDRRAEEREPDAGPGAADAAPQVALPGVPGLATGRATVAGHRALLARLPPPARPLLARHVAQTYGNAHAVRVLARSGDTTNAPPAVTKGGSAKAAGTVAWSDVQDLAQKAVQGRWALKIMSDNKVALKTTASGPPAYFTPDTNEVVLNLSLRVDVVAAYFVHEMHHAAQFHGGKSPAATTMAKDDWVKTLVTEEVTGTWRGFEAKREWEEAGLAPKDDEPPQMSFYRGAFQHGYDEALKDGKTEAEAVKAGQANGMRMTRFLIAPSDGTWARLAPNQFETYTMYYEREWRQAAAKAAKAQAAPVP